MRIVDISPMIRASSPVWPGDTAFELRSKWSIESGDSVSVGTVTSTTHIGAHIDSPAHVVADAPTIESISLDACIGPCVVLDVSDLVGRDSQPHRQVQLEALLSRIAAATEFPVERLLLRHATAERAEWDPDLPGLDPRVVRWFAAQGGKLIGLDLASFDPVESKSLDAHREAIAGGIVMLEGLDLSNASEGEAELIALPLPWEGADASPVRAVLRYA